MSRASATKALPLAERRFAEHHAAGAILVWPAPPLVRVGAWGTEVAPAATGQVTAMINGTPLVRFPQADGTTSEPMELVAGQSCRLGGS